LFSSGDLQEAFRLVALFLLKAAALATLAAILLVSAPLDATLKAAHALYVPGLLIQLVLLSYRYLFVLGDELARLRVALRVRGFRNRPNRHSYRTIGQVAGTLLVRGYERAERVSQAMRCRGFDGRFRSLVSFRTRLVDVLALLLVVAAALSVVWLDVSVQ
jgi:cobalt/nickel transport system permease protein